MTRGQGCTATAISRNVRRNVIDSTLIWAICLAYDLWKTVHGPWVFGKAPPPISALCHCRRIQYLGSAVTLDPVFFILTRLGISTSNFFKGRKHHQAHRSLDVKIAPSVFGGKDHSHRNAGSRAAPLRSLRVANPPSLLPTDSR